MPLHIFWELVDALDDLLIFAMWHLKARNIRKALDTISEVIRSITALGSFDMVDVEAGNQVKIRICLR
jgi:hypothetical protein